MAPVALFPSTLISRNVPNNSQIYGFAKKTVRGDEMGSSSLETPGVDPDLETDPNRGGWVYTASGPVGKMENPDN